MQIMKRTLRATAKDLIHFSPFDEQGLRSSIVQSLNRPSVNVASKDLKDFVVVNDEQYHRGSDGALTRGLSLVNTKEGLCQIHDLSYKENDINLCTCLQK